MFKITPIVVLTCSIFANTVVGQDLGLQTRLPVAKSFPTPVFPAGVSTDGIVGAAHIRAKIDTLGNVSVLDSFGPNAPCSKLDDPRIAAIRDAVAKAVEKTNFDPALKAGDKVDAELILLYSFDVASEKQWQIFRPADYDPRRLGEYAAQKKISGDLVRGKAIKLPKPKVSFKESLFGGLSEGTVSVYVLIDKNGQVVSASALNGEMKLRDRSTKAACKAVFSPTTLDGVPIRVSGSIVYDFKK